MQFSHAAKEISVGTARKLPSDREADVFIVIANATKKSGLLLTIKFLYDTLKIYILYFNTTSVFCQGKKRCLPFKSPQYLLYKFVIFQQAFGIRLHSPSKKNLHFDNHLFAGVLKGNFNLPSLNFFL
jgi:hypothetical protein